MSKIEIVGQSSDAQVSTEYIDEMPWLQRESTHISGRRSEVSLADDATVTVDVKHPDRPLIRFQFSGRLLIAADVIKRLA